MATIQFYFLTNGFFYILICVPLDVIDFDKKEAGSFQFSDDGESNNVATTSAIKGSRKGK